MVMMKRPLSTLIAILVLALPLIANEHYLLPEHKSDFMHTLKRKIARAESITIISSRLDNPSLSKSIEKAIKHGAAFHLITTDLTSASFYAKYKNTQVDVPTSQRLRETFNLNILLIDRSDVCFSTLAFDEAVLKKEIGMVTCTTNKEDIAFAINIEQDFTERFEDYNQ